MLFCLDQVRFQAQASALKDPWQRILEALCILNFDRMSMCSSIAFGLWLESHGFESASLAGVFRGFPFPPRISGEH